MIREATIEDIPAVLVLLEHFWRDIGPDVIAQFDGPLIADKIGRLIESDSGLILLSESGLSGAGFVASEALWSSDIYAQELFWWVHPSERGGGLGKAMRVAGEEWGQSLGAHSMVMIALTGSSPNRLHSVYSKAGYKKTETHYMKAL